MGRRKITRPLSRESSNEVSAFETLITVAEIDPGVEKLDLHGKDVLDAELEIGRFLDQQFVAGEHVVKIVYGVGRGVLAVEVPKIVKRSPHVLYSKVAASGGEGGAVIYVVINK